MIILPLNECGTRYCYRQKEIIKTLITNMKGMVGGERYVLLTEGPSVARGKKVEKKNVEKNFGYF